MTKARGRPTKYKREFAKQAEKLCQLGATDADLADFFEVNVTTIWRWQSAHPDFCKALKVGKDEGDARVERSLYQKAVGYEFDAVKIFMPAGAEEPVYAPYREKVAPDTTAAIFWLKNRRREAWRDQPSGRDAPVSFEVPGITSAADAVKAMARLLEAVAKGELTPAQGAAVATVLDGYRKTFETEELERRLELIEEKDGQ